MSFSFFHHKILSMCGICFFVTALFIPIFFVQAAGGFCNSQCSNPESSKTGEPACTKDDDCKPACDKFCKSFGGCGSAKCEGASSAPSGKYGLNDPLEGATVSKVIGGLIKYVMGFVGALFFLLFVYGGFVYLTSGGDSAQVKKAKSVLSRATVGIVIVILSYFLVNILLTFSGQILKI